MGEFPGSIDCFVDPERTFIGENDHKAIVAHGTGGNPDMTVEQLGDFFRTTPSMVSVHYGIGRDGRIAQYCPESAGAGGNGILDPGHDPFWDQYSDNPNKHSLSFETINDSSNSLALTDPQKQTTFRLVAYWVKKYNIPLSNIKGHFSLEPVQRASCPGPNFPWQELFNYLNGEQTTMIDLTNPTVASHFVAAPNGAWHCPATNATIGGEILATYQKFGGDALSGLTYWGLPLTSEVPIPGKPGTVLQRFERVIAAFDPNHTVDNPPGSGRVYLLHIDSGIGQDPRVNDLQGQITALTAQLAALQPATLAATNMALQAKIAQAVKDLS